MIKGKGRSYRRAKQLRREMTLPEILLWRELKVTTSHWRKQHPAGDYILDFYCDLPKLCVEVDGAAHERGNRPIKDARRDAWRAGAGIETIRISAREIFANLDGVLTHIEATARERAPLHRPADGPPPPAGLGEDF